MASIITVENLGKKYTIRHEHPERYTALRDVMARQVKKLFSFPRHLRPSAPATDYEEFWALKDINFEIQQGDRVGIIGRNGAGKSTLLKILSRITEPSTGRIELNGRVASLLEVGTGFHPELTGRENIYLNGAILGMSRAEIRRKFDEIVDFSGVEKFLDTPVKRYSSGMYVRLAFAVAAHLEPEILVVDEVLAVGDAEFQKKCLGKMEDVSKNEGRTVLFVSHNMGTMVQVCNQGLLLEKGQIQYNGIISGAINKYAQNRNIDQGFIRQEKNEYFKFAGLKKIRLKGESDDEKNTFLHDEAIIIEFYIDINQKQNDNRFLVIVSDILGKRIFSSEYIGLESYLRLRIPGNILVRGEYYISTIIYIPGNEVIDEVKECCQLTVLDNGSMFSHLETFDYGLVFSNSQWI